MLATTRIIDLPDGQQISRGTVRLVFEFPDQPDLLIKVFHDFKKRSSRKRLKRLAWKLFPTYRFRSILSELKCEMLVVLKLGTALEQIPISRMFGVVQTSRGPGVIVERINGPDKQLAPSLHAFFRAGKMDENVLEALNEFVERMFRLKIVARDVNLSNIVYGLRDNREQCILIDGYGERNLIPLRSMSKRLNDRSLNKQFMAIAEGSGLEWDSGARRLSNAP